MKVWGYATFEGLLTEILTCRGLDKIEVLKAYEDDNDLYFELEGPEDQLEEFGKLFGWEPLEEEE